MSIHKKKLLIIDDDRLLCDTIQEALADLNVSVAAVHTGAEGIARCRATPYDIVLLDQKLPDARGVDYCKPILTHNERTKIIFITAYPSFENAVQALKVGAHDYLSKPFDIEELRLAVIQALRTLDLEQLEQVQRYKNKVEGNQSILIGHQSGLQDVQRLVDLAAANHAPVLITGETGTGKTMVAKAIHYSGRHRSCAFIRVNCAAIPENLMEAELFGYEKGAFTGAVSASKGIFEMAADGTLFLDEIGEIPRHLQSKLLGVLDEQHIKRLGSQSLKPVNARIVAATNMDLENAIRKGLFREDLFFRLSVIRIHIPPLRERLEDINDLCRHFINQIAPDQGIALPKDELRALHAYAWKGNVRELRNVVERAILVREGSLVHPSHLLLTGGDTLSEENPQQSRDEPILPLRELEEQHIRRALAKLNGNHTQVAQHLGISRSTLIRKLKAMSNRDGATKSDTVLF